MNARAINFIRANEDSPVVYGSVDGHCVTYRLANGKMFRLNTEDARQAPNPRWAFLEREMNAGSIAKHEAEEAKLLDRIREEAGE
jgi:hypothetical protein